ncbi:Soluble lytic murein transglycosylase-like regulatory protein [Rickettsia prowazekii str. GvF12]|nr:Soluble lytic murein transglycosylase-like regulatory protein [Rickettsia prowazekii str. GvF12]
MNIKLVTYFLILVSSLKVNADLNHIQDSFKYQEAERLTIELPWNDCTAIHKFLEEKLFFSEQQIKKKIKFMRNISNFIYNIIISFLIFLCNF